MNTSRHLTLAFLLALAVCIVGCQHTQEKAVERKPDLPWGGFGEPGVGKICVFVGGDIKHPGLYYLIEGASLDSVYYSFGGWGGHGDFGGTPPLRVSITRNMDGAQSKQYYQIKKMTKEQRDAVKLKDGDVLEYPTVYF
jgi:hypothetical protein